MSLILKGVAALVITMIISITINIVCNMNGIELNSIALNTVSTTCVLLIYFILIKNEKK